MKSFFLVALCVFALANTYIFVRGWQALEIIGRYRIIYAVVFWLAAASFIISHAVRGAGTWQIIGSTWVVVMLYATMLLLCIDIVRLTAWIGHFRPSLIHANYPLAKITLLGLVMLSMAAIMAFGYRNARYPVVKELDLTSKQHAGSMKTLRIVCLSDIHLGHTAGRAFLSRIVDEINTLDADIVCLAGDTFDGDPNPVISLDMGAEFDRVKTRFGIFAIAGNHEHIGERFGQGTSRRAFDYLGRHGVTVLLDSVVKLNDSFFVAGRKDLSAGRRKTVAELLQPTEGCGLPVILLDHQPFHLEESEKAGVMLQLSGHTHHGQMFPLNFITSNLYECDWGYYRKGDTQYYISCGVGTWGPKVRSGSRSEIVLIKMNFE